MSEKLIFKANLERREITMPILIPNVVDAHGDIYSEEEVLKACRNFNEVCKRTNLQHEFMMDDDAAKFIESYVTVADSIVDGVPIVKGSWLGTMAIKNDALWKSVKDGEFTAFSIGCMAKVENLDGE